MEKQTLLAPILVNYAYKKISGDVAIERLFKAWSSLKDKADKYTFLRELYFTDVNLHFELVRRHMKVMLPIIYTPTVGHMISNYSTLIGDNRGIFISYSYIGEDMCSLLTNNVTQAEIYEDH